MTGSGVESELKLRALDERPLRDLEAAERLGPADLGPPATVDELDRYLDTADLRLAALQWACRLRSREGKTVVSLKGPLERDDADPVHRRPELEGPADASLDPGRWPPSAARERLQAMTDGAPLAERIALEQQRTERTVTVFGLPVGTLSLDRVRVVQHRIQLGKLLVVELEFAGAAVDDPAAVELASALAALPGLTHDPLTKLERALAMLHDA